MATDTTTAPELTAEQVQRILSSRSKRRPASSHLAPVSSKPPKQIRIPSSSTASPPLWYAENEQITDDSADFDEVVLLPSTMKSVKVLTRYSNELARQSVVSLDQTLRDRLVGDVARALDTQFYSASGDGVTTPRGMFAWTGTQTLAVDAALSIDDRHDAEGLALAENVDPSRLR